MRRTLILPSRRRYALIELIISYAFIRASEEAEARRQNEERQQLDQLAAAQAERAKALEEKDAAQRRERRNMLAGSMVALALAVLAAGFGFYALKQKNEALTQTERAEKQRQVAEAQKNEADRRREEASRYLYESQINRARGLVEKAESFIQGNNHEVLCC